MHKLERKYARWVKIFHQARSDEAVRKVWQQHLERGEVAGPMWAALTHKVASKETCNQEYGDVHMLSQQIGAGCNSGRTSEFAFSTRLPRMSGIPAAPFSQVSPSHRHLREDSPTTWR